MQYRTLFVAIAVCGCWDGSDRDRDFGDASGSLSTSDAVAGDAVLPWGDATLSPPIAEQAEAKASVLCELSGTANTVIDCPVVVARATQGSPPPVALQGDVFYASSVQPTMLFERICSITPLAQPWETGYACTDKRLKNKAVLRSGHTVEATPGDPSQWSQGGKLEIAHLTVPGTPLSAAYLKGGYDLEGVTYPEDAAPVWIRFVIRQAIPANKPVQVMLRGVQVFAAAGSKTALTIGGAKVDGVVYSQGVVATPTNCKALPSVCDDSNVCTDDYCDPVSGLCKYIEKDKTPCNDGNACTTGDVCAGRICGGGLVTCDDGNPCTIDSCIAQTGCSFTDNTVKAPANYGLGDASYTVCADPLSWDKAAAACEKLGKSLVQLDTSDETTFVAQQVGGLSFLTDYWIALSDTKAEGVFEWRAGNPAAPFFPWIVPPANSDASDCVALRGNPSMKQTIVAALADCGASRAFVCETDCDDLNPCTDDKLQGGKCVYTPNTAKCEDGNLCTLADACAAGKCVPGAPKNCTDGNPCTDDRCDPSGTCTSTIPGALQTPSDLYVFCPEASNWDAAKAACGKIGMKLATVVDAPTNWQLAEKAKGIKENASYWLGLNDVATEGTYRWDDGSSSTYTNWAPLQGAPPSSQEDCTAISTSATELGLWSDNVCTESRPFVCALRCNDSNPCTHDQVGSDGKCIYTAIDFTCEDGDLCTDGDYCKAGACTSGPKKTCNDGDPCTWDSCVAGKGCSNTSVLSWKTGETRALQFCPGKLSWTDAKGNCEGRGGALGLEVPAGAGDSAQAAAFGGFWLAATDLATEGAWRRALVKGEAAITPAPTWASGEPSNSPAEKDCAFASFGEPWTAGRCGDTRGFVCEYGCKPKNACQVATSDPVLGCRLTNAPNGTACDDLDPCTNDGSCQAGVCKLGSPKVCDDKNPCTTDSCRVGVGCEAKTNYVLTGYSKNSGYIQCKEPRTWADAVSACTAQGPDWELFAPEAPEELAQAAGKGLLTPDLHLGVSDRIKEGTFRGGGADANAADFKVPLAQCVAPKQYQNTDENDYMYAGISGGAACVSLSAAAVTRPFLCKKSCRPKDPRDWTYYDFGECKTDNRLVVRLPQKAPDGVLRPGAEADKYKNEPLVFRLMPPATAAEAIAACKAVGATPAPWFVSREKELAALTGNYGIDRLWTGQTWIRKYGSYTKNAFYASTSVNVADPKHWENSDSGWGVPPDFWCGFQNAQDGYGVGLSAWPVSPYACDVSGVPRTCVHPYSKSWHTPGQLGKGAADWWLWGGTPKPASGSQSFQPTQSLWKWGTSPSAGTLELATCIKSTGTNGQNQTETRDDCWQDACMQSKIGDCVATRSTCAEKRPYLCEMSTQKWQLKSGGMVTSGDFPCGICSYWDPASSSCKPNLVQFGQKQVLACTYGTPVDNKTDFAGLVASGVASPTTACAEISKQVFANLKVAKLDAAQLATLSQTLKKRQYPGGTLGVGPLFPADKYVDWGYFDGTGIGQTGCTLLDIQNGNTKGCSTAAAEHPDGKALIYRVLCEQTCPGQTGPCYTSAFDAGLNCTGTTLKKDVGTPCDDSDPCTTGETCNENGQCFGGQSLSCGGDACTPQQCVPGFGCVATPVRCDDDNPCTIDSCVVEGGKATCKNVVQTCPNDGDACTDDVCKPGIGCYDTTECDDLDPCTEDSCAPATGCIFTKDPDYGTSPLCKAPAPETVKEEPVCVTLSANKKVLTVSCLPKNAVMNLEAKVGTWFEQKGEASVVENGVKTRKPYIKYLNKAPLVAVSSPSLKLPLGLTSIPLPGALLKVTATNPPSIQGTLTGLPGLGFGLFQGFAFGTSLFPDTPLKLAWGPAKFLQEKYFEDDQPIWCQFSLPVAKDVCAEIPTLPPLPLPEDAMWFAIVWDASSIGVEMELPGLDAEHTLSAPGDKIKNKAIAKGVSPNVFGKIGVLFDPFDPGFYIRLQDFPMLSDLGIEAGAFGLSYKGQFEVESILPVRLVKWIDGAKQLVKEKFKATGNFYAMLSISLAKFLKIPLKLTGELLVNLDPNQDGAILIDTVKKVFTGGEIPSLSNGTDKDFSLLGQVRADVSLGFGDISPKLKALGEISFTIGKALLSLDTRPDVPQAGLRVAGEIASPKLPSILTLIGPNGSLSGELWIASSDTFGLELKGNYKMLKVIGSLAPQAVGELVISTNDIRLALDIELFGQALKVKGWVDPSSGSFELCTDAGISLNFGTNGPLPKGTGRVCLGSSGILVELHASINATLAGAVQVVIDVVEKVFKAVVKFIAKIGCKFLSLFNACDPDKVVETIEDGFRVVKKWVTENLSFGFKVGLDFGASWNWTDFPDIALGINADIVWKNSSLAGFSAQGAVKNGRFQFSFEPLGAVCIDIKALSISKGSCP